MEKDERIYVAGHTGLLGKALVSALRRAGYKNIITRTRKELDLTKDNSVESFFKEESPQYVILCAARVGGINANIKYPAQFIYENTAINMNVISASCKFKVKRLIFFGSSCSYPVDCLEPFKEEMLFTGNLEKTSRPYAMAKLCGIEACLSYNKEMGTHFMVLIPATLYGPGEKCNSEDGHVLSSLVGKFLKAKKNKQNDVVLWGTGNAEREFLHVEDMADAVCFFLNLPDNKIDWNYPVINIGWGEAISIKGLAGLISKKVGYKGRIKWDRSMPDGALKKVFSIGKMKNYNFKCKINLDEGLKRVLNI